MKNPRPFIPWACVLTLILICTGCIAPDAESTTGTRIGNTIAIGDILEQPSLYNGTSVLVRGKVVNECGSGCWFFLDDGTGTIYIDLLPNNFAIPPMVGSTVTVEGTIRMDGSDVYMVGTTVLSDLGVYR